MFRCTKAPSEPSVPADLTQLGFQVKDGQFVDKQGKHFAYYYTNNERANDLRKEAIHICVRKVVANQLKDKYGIHELFLTGPGGITLRTHRPDAPHVAFLATELSELRKKKDVVVVIGEAIGQDAGIWAYRILMREGGINSGSAVGLAAKLAAKGSSFAQDNYKDRTMEDLTSTTANLDIRDKAQPEKTRLALSHSETRDAIPGLLILNGGQLLYSHLENRSMSLSTWQARPRKTALDDEYHIDEKHNFVPGHKTPLQHTVTVFEHILPYLLREGVRLYVICIGDGAETAIKCFDQIFANNLKTGLAEQLEAIALVQPYFNPADVVSEPLKMLLASRSRSWIESALPFGKLVQTPLPAMPTFDRESVASLEQADKSLNSNKVVEEDKGDLGAFATYVDAKDEVDKTHEQQEILCPTFSAGDCNSITETVFPKVIDEVLGFFWQARAEAEQLKAMHNDAPLATELH